MKKLLSLALIAIFLLILGACSGGGGSSSSAGAGVTGTANGFSGQAQKGPLLFGSEITIYELDEKLQQTGRSFDAQTTDDLGNFKVTANINTNLVTMVGVGYYMDELTGGLSSAPVTLNAIADLSVDSTPTINILTTLATPRIKKLILSGKSYTEAISQAQKEVLAVFGIDAAKISDLQALYSMKINGSGDQDAALLATSAVLSQMASDSALAGSSPAAQMSYFLSRIASDVANFGKLNTPSIQTALTTAGTEVNLSGVRANVQTYYANRGVAINAPKFEEWIDKSNSGILPQRLVPAAGLNFSNTTAEIGTSITSNAVTVSGIGTGITAQANITGSSNASNTPGSGNNNNWKLIKNNSIVPTSYTTVQDGDTLAVQLTADGFGSQVTATVSVGSSSGSWVVTTRKPQVVYDQTGNLGVPQSASNKYFAVPVFPSTTSTVNYVGVAVGASTTPAQVAIYTDNGGVPGTALITTTNISAGGYFQGSGYTKIDGTPYSTFSYPQAQLSTSDSFTMQAGVTYWIVLKYNSTTTPALNNGIPIGNGYHRKMSSDGTAWVNWQGTSGNSDDANPSMLPGNFLAN